MSACMFSPCNVRICLHASVDKTQLCVFASAFDVSLCGWFWMLRSLVPCQVIGVLAGISTRGVNGYQIVGFVR